MGQTLYCEHCGLPVLIGGEFQPCPICNGMKFVPWRALPFEAALTEEDRKFLRVNKIAVT